VAAGAHHGFVDRGTGVIAALAGGLPFTRLRREAAVTPSPNSGWPMAAMALALDARLSKPGVYALNEAGRAPDAAATAKALRLSDQAVAVMLAWSCLAIFLLARELPW
jgi:adenosylcobinamide-phosphate synthase